MGFDPKCLDLAEHFLTGDIELGQDFSKEALAQEIQTAVEGWFEYRRARFTVPMATMNSPPFTFKRSPSLRIAGPGEWRPIAIGDGHTAMIGCPACGEESVLSRHTINAEGCIEENVECLHNRAHHYRATLEGWAEHGNFTGAPSE